MHTARRVAVTASAVTALLLSSVGAALATSPTDDPVEAAAGWLTTQLTDGRRITVQFGDDVFDSYGPTADVLFALAGAGVASGYSTAIADWFDQPDQVAGYTGDGVDEIYAGATGKLLLVAATAGRDPTDFGGRDLVAQLTGRRDVDGRFRDESAFGDFSSTLTQAVAVLGLYRTDTGGLEPEDVQFLLDQQCADGGFRFDPDTGDCTSQVDTTGMVVQALFAVGGPDADNAVSDAVEWLVEVQEESGGFAGSAEPANANSTGLAALALSLGGADDAAAAARAWIVTLQHDCDDDEPGAIQAMTDDPGDLVLATTQALWGMSAVSLADVTVAGASEAVPLLDCAPTDEEPIDDGPDDGADDGPDDEADEVLETGPDVRPAAQVDTTAPVLPETGGERTSILLLGGVMLGLGALLVAAGRRSTSA